jgi:hypothetical protein
MECHQPFRRYRRLSARCWRTKSIQPRLCQRTFIHSSRGHREVRTSNFRFGLESSKISKFEMLRAFPSQALREAYPGAIYHYTRFFATTGVCWYLADKGLDSEAVALLVQQAYCTKFGVQERDLGVGLFYTKQAPSASTTCHGACVFDATNGSLRLTQRLAERFSEVLDFAIETSERRADAGTVRLLRSFAMVESELRPAAAATVSASSSANGAEEQEWVTVIGPGESAMYMSDDGPRKVLVKGHRYTPHGLMYQLEPAPRVDRWMVAANALEAIYGKTKMVRANLITGETQELERPSEKVAGA